MTHPVMPAHPDVLLVDALERVALRELGDAWTALEANGAVMLFRKLPSGKYTNRYVWRREDTDAMIDWMLSRS